MRPGGAAVKPSVWLVQATRSHCNGGVDSLSTLQVRPGEIRVGEIGVRQVGIDQLSIPQIGAGQIRVGQGGAAEVRTHERVLTIFAPLRFAKLNSDREKSESEKSAPGASAFTMTVCMRPIDWFFMSAAASMCVSRACVRSGSAQITDQSRAQRSASRSVAPAVVRKTSSRSGIRRRSDPRLPGNRQSGWCGPGAHGRASHR